jgi:hypothetical protein
MAVSVTLSGGGSIIAWQTTSGISFQRFDASHAPVGAVTSVAARPSVWISAEPLAGGGFSLVWDADASSQPLAQNFDANGVAVGSAFVDTAPPIADIAFTSRASDQVRSTTSPYSETATVLLPDGGSVIGSTYYAPLYGITLPVASVQRLDAAGNTLGSGYQQTGFRIQWSDFSAVPMADGGYAAGFVSYSSSAVFLTVLRFDADGTLLGTVVPSLDAGPQPPPRFVNDYEIAGLPNGNFVVAWTTFGVLHVREYDAAAQPVTADLASGITFDSQVAHTSAIDVFPDGACVVSVTTAEGVEYAAFTSAGSPVPPADNDLIVTIAPAYTLPAGPHDVKLIGDWAQSVTGNEQDNIIASNDHVTTLRGAGGHDTLIAGRNANILSGGDGADTFVFKHLPWNNTGHITDFALGTDRLDLTAIFAASGYGGSDPIADGFVQLQSDGADGTSVLFDLDGAGSTHPWPIHITTLEHVSPAGLTATQLFNPMPPPTGQRTPLPDGGYIETREIEFSYSYWQKYDSAGAPVGPEHAAYRPSGLIFTPLPDGGYVVSYTPFRGGGHGPTDTVLEVFGPTGTSTGSQLLYQAAGPLIVTSADSFAVSFVFPAFSYPEGDAAFSIYDLAGAPLTGFLVDNRPEITVLSNGDFSISWTDDGGSPHTLVIDPQNPPSLTPPETPVVTALDNVGPVQGPITTVTDDTTPTLRIAVQEIGAIEIGQGLGSWYAITAEDVARGYKEIELSLAPGVYSHSVDVRFQDADGLLSQWADIGFAVETGGSGQTFIADDTRDQSLAGGTGDDIFYAGHNSVVVTGGGGADRFVFPHLPWNTSGHITDFVLGTDTLDLTALFAMAGYTGSDPVADGYIRLESDGADGTRVLFDLADPAPCIRGRS